MGQPSRGRRLPQPGQLTIGEELLGYHNNNNNSHNKIIMVDVVYELPKTS